MEEYNINIKYISNGVHGEFSCSSKNPDAKYLHEHDVLREIVRHLQRPYKASMPCEANVLSTATIKADMQANQVEYMSYTFDGKVEYQL